jgi:hypothetical protein
MSEQSENTIGDTVRILRPPPRVVTALNGRNVWMGEVEPLELALEDSSGSDPYNNTQVTGHTLVKTTSRP